MKQTIKLPEVGVPYFWPFGLALDAFGKELQFAGKNLEFLDTVVQTQVVRPRPDWASAHKVRLELHTMRLLDFSPAPPSAPVTLILPPYAGHTSTIADFHKGQSLVETFLEHGGSPLCAVDWKSATAAMKDYDIDTYLAELNVCIDEIGTPANLVGLCQGGWLAAMYAARFPGKVRTLVLAGAPIDTDAGETKIRDAAHLLPMSFYERLVQLGGGVLRGAFMLRGFKNMHPDKQYLEKYVDLYENIDDPEYVHRFEAFERWYEATVDLPGKWYVQVIEELFKENRFFKGTFVGLGKRLNLQQVTCPVYLLAGDDDDITPKEQVFNAEHRLGTPGPDIAKSLASGGHIGLFMGRTALTQQWPGIVEWIKHGGGKDLRHAHRSKST